MKAAGSNSRRSNPSRDFGEYGHYLYPNGAVSWGICLVDGIKITEGLDELKAKSAEDRAAHHRTLCGDKKVTSE